MNGAGAVPGGDRHIDIAAAARTEHSSLRAAYAGIAAYDEGVAFQDCPFPVAGEATLREVWQRYWLARRARRRRATGDLFELKEPEGS